MNFDLDRQGFRKKESFIAMERNEKYLSFERISVSVPFFVPHQQVSRNN